MNRLFSLRLDPDPAANPASGAPAVPTALKVGDKDYSSADIQKLIADHQAAQAQVTRLTSIEQNLDALMNAKDAGAEEQATRSLLAAKGRSSSEIDAYINQVKSAAANVARPAAKAKEEDDEVDPIQQQTQQELAALKRSQANAWQVSIKREMEEARNRVLGPDTELGKLLTKAEAAKGVDTIKPMRAMLETQVDMALRTNLREKISRTNDFQVDYLRDAAKDLSASLVQTYRPVLGDPSFLGKSPETAGGEDVLKFLESEPVKAPKWEPGKSNEVSEQLMAFAKDSLKRGMAEEARSKAESLA